MATTVKRKSATQLKPATPNKAKYNNKRAQVSEPEESEPEDSDSEVSDAGSIASLDDEDELDDLSGAESGSEDGNENEDSLDESEGAEDSDEDDIAEEDGPQQGDAAKTSANSHARQEKKRLAKERKLGKAHGEAIEQVKKLWERLREKQGVSKAERSKLVYDVMRLVDGNWKDVVFRHDSSRVVQTVFKYADKALRNEITLALKGTYVQLAKSAYGKYLLVKMLHYGSPSVRAGIIDEMHGSFRRLMGHKEGAYVLEDMYREYATAKQRRQIMREFYGSEFALFKDAGDGKADLREILAEHPEKRPFLLENLNKVITQAISKGSIGFEIVHAMMLEYIRNLDHSPKSMDRETFIDLIADDFVEMVHTNPGSQVASLALAISTAKERKRLLKSLRQFPLKLAKDNFGTIVLMASFLTVDDTKLVHKAFSELDGEFYEILVDRYARRPFLMLLVGPQNTKYFGVLQQRFKEIAEFKQEFSKKDDAARQQELLEAFAPSLRKTVVENAGALLKDSLGAQFIQEFLLNESARDEETLKAVLAAFDSDPQANKAHLFNTNPFSGRFIKALLRAIPEVRAQVSKMVAQYPVSWTTGEGAFAVVALLESLDGADKKKLQGILKKHVGAIKKSDTKARDLLLQLV